MKYYLFVIFFSSFLILLAAQDRPNDIIILADDLDIEMLGSMVMKKSSPLTWIRCRKNPW